MQTSSPPTPSRQPLPTVHPRVMVVQDGARLHYAVPISLQKRNALSRVYTPWYTKPNSLSSLIAKSIRRIDPKRGQRMLDRNNPLLDSSLVHTRLLMSLRQQFARSKFPSDRTFHAWESKQVGDWIKNAGFGPDTNAIFGFIRNISPELCEHARDKGLVVVADQMIATLAEESHQEALQSARFPQWLPTKSPQPTDNTPDPFPAIEARTWQTATAITCASEYVKSSLLQQGIPDHKIHVLPYPIDSSHYTVPDRSKRTGPVRVGFVGACGLRKGTPFLVEVARRLQSQSVHFELIGGCQADPKLLANHPNLNFIGHIPRSQILSHLHNFDIFFFPSTCEGSPGAVMEAMATGLPIVSTPNSGTVVRDGVEGFIRNYDDLDGLTESLQQLISSPSLRRDMGHAARKRAEHFNPDAYGQDLFNVFAQALAQNPR